MKTYLLLTPRLGIAFNEEKFTVMGMLEPARPPVDRVCFGLGVLSLRPAEEPSPGERSKVKVMKLESNY